MVSLGTKLILPIVCSRGYYKPRPGVLGRSGSGSWLCSNAFVLLREINMFVFIRKFNGWTKKRGEALFIKRRIHSNKMILLQKLQCLRLIKHRVWDIFENVS